MIYSIVHYVEIVFLRKEVLVDQVHTSLLRRGAFSIAVFNQTAVLKRC